MTTTPVPDSAQTETRKTFHEHLDELRVDVIRLAALTTEQIAGGTQALLDGDLSAADTVIENDDAVDDLTHSIEDRVFLLLARQQPIRHQDVGQRLFELFLIKTLYVNRRSTDAQVLTYLAEMLTRFLWSRELLPGATTAQLGDLLTLGQRLGHRLAMHLGELRLEIERLEVRRTARHREPDHALHFGSVVRRLKNAGPGLACIATGESGAKQSRVQERSQGHGAECAPGPPEKNPPGLLLERELVFVAGDVHSNKGSVTQYTEYTKKESLTRGKAPGSAS